MKEQCLSELFVHVEMQTGIIEAITFFSKLMEWSQRNKETKRQSQDQKARAGVGVCVGHNVQLMFAE